MATLTGVLLDVSLSMSQNFDAGKSNTESRPWVRSVFKTMDNLIRYDVSSENHVFAIGVGTDDKRQIFDILNTISETIKPFDPFESLSFHEIIEEILSILNSGGARYIRKFLKHDVFQRAIPRLEAAMILTKLKSDSSFVRDFIFKYLPKRCREGLVVCSYDLTDRIQATEDDIKQIIEKAKGSHNRKVDMVPVTDRSILPVHDASKILHGCINQDELTDLRIDELMKAVKPHIYGQTPLYKALRETISLFKECRFRDYKKLLFILSDGMPNDDWNNSIRDLKMAGVVVTCCYVTNANISDPKRLYNCEQSGWGAAVKLMFDFSSTLPTELIPRTIFIKRGWSIDIDNNETKLFVQVNNPDIIDDICDLARNVVCCQDALSDTLTCVSLDLYINQYNSGFNAQRQIEGTCYANASATVLHLAMKRILGRDDGYPEFSAVRDDMIKQYGNEKATTLKVLKAVCPKYRLHCKVLSTQNSFSAIVAKRPVVAKFRLTDDEWSTFVNFYQRRPFGILMKRDLDISRRRRGDKLSGHAVVFTSFNSQCLRLMNSWGSEWADKGFFRVENADILGLEFFDVYWELDDLSAKEKAYYDTHGHKVAAELISTLKGLQQSNYECPLCMRESLVTEFTGNLVQAKCPKCNEEFKSDSAGNILALNMYLTSLSSD